MFGVGSPLAWNMSSDGQAEMVGTYTEHIPQVLAGVVILSGLVLFALDKAGFRFAVEVGGGR